MHKIDLPVLISGLSASAIRRVARMLLRAMEPVCWFFSSKTASTGAQVATLRYGACADPQGSQNKSLTCLRRAVDGEARQALLVSAYEARL